ncbi:uncharacterized protein LOC110690901 isoform X2 [Chenopodium quinoa]|uniref:uncharacterized protein LOC110690901 isoform X2 n=1 Tax=Chenopodium quinoa TaxID=63459 RepID=UPI000B790E22|nr:uncharacterized protein LOC110690901 isoform X2 [Chenopodium quinoa]
MNNNNSSNKSQLSSISSASDLIDAKLEEHQLCGSKQCPGCGHRLEGSKPDWVGLPAGVKFDPTDQELIEHLEAKVEGKSSKSHPLIDEFIPTIEGEDGICYTHPEKLPGVTRDGLSRHFFHRPSKAYTTGTRKRRKIQTECDLQGGETRWHKTGKTRPVMVNGKQKGCKKILVLYTNFGKNRKPEKTNWVMHQYHLGQHEEEKEGELVVSKIFYQTQPRQCNWTMERSATTGDGSEPSGRRESGSGSGSTSSSKEVITHHSRDDQISISAGVNVVGGAAAALSSFTALDMQHLRAAEQFSFNPFANNNTRKGFDEAGMGDGSTTVRESAAMSAACDDHEPRPQHHQLHHHPHAMNAPQDHHHHHTHQSIATSAAFHMSRPSHPISQIISPPPLHHASIILDDDSFHHVSRIMLQNENFHHHQQQQQQQQHQQQQQQQQTTQQQQHHKLGGRSAAGLEEIIMGCTSSASDGGDIKEESSMTNPPAETDWMKYSSFWHDPDHSDPHHYHG